MTNHVTIENVTVENAIPFHEPRYLRCSIEQGTVEEAVSNQANMSGSGRLQLVMLSWDVKNKKICIA